MPASVDMIKKDRISNSKYRSIRKSRNKIVKNLTKLLSQNLPKPKSGNLIKFKNFIKVQSASTINKPNSLILNTRVVFTELR